MLRACRAVVCNQYPAHAHWHMVGASAESTTPTVHISWGQFGEYQLELTADGQQMAGGAFHHANGLDLANWRRAKRIQTINKAAVHQHDH